MRGLANSILGSAGRNGPALLCGGVFIGLLAPALAEWAKPCLGIGVAVFTLGAFLKVEASEFRAEAKDRQVMALILAWSTFGVPFAAVLFTRALGLGDELSIAITLCALAPPVGSAAAIAAMLGLSAPLALFATVVATLAAPFYLPPLAAQLAGAELTIEPLGLFLRLSVIVGGAALVAWLLRRFASNWVCSNPNAMTGVAVLGLLLVAIGAMHGMREEILAQPWRAGLMLGLAFALNLAAQAAGVALFYALGRQRALTVGLISGNRNITLIWAAAAPFLAGQPGVELFLAMSIFPIFMLPLMIQKLLSVDLDNMAAAAKALILILATAIWLTVLPSAGGHGVVIPFWEGEPGKTHLLHMLHLLGSQDELLPQFAPWGWP